MHVTPTFPFARLRVKWDIVKNLMSSWKWDLNIQTDHLISARWPDCIIINNSKKKKKENLQNCGFCCPGSRLKENEKKDKYLDLARELKVTIIPIVITEKSPGDLSRLAVTQTSVKDNQRRLMWKILKG